MTTLTLLVVVMMNAFTNSVVFQMSRLFRAALIMFFVLSCHLGAHGGVLNLLSNPSFESGTGSGVIDDWDGEGDNEFRDEETAFGYTLGEGTFPDGDFALKVFSADADLTQSNIPVTESIDYFYSIMFYHSSTEDTISPVANSLRGFIHVEWFDAGGDSIQNDFTANHNGTSPADEWVEISGLFVAPAGAVTATFHIETDQDVGGGSMFADNVMFGNAVPEPGTMNFLFMGTLGLVVCRRIQLAAAAANKLE